MPELSAVNTVICEQSFAWSNEYCNVRSMSGPRFNHFFHYLLDLHNLKVLYIRWLNLFFSSSFFFWGGGGCKGTPLSDYF